MSAHLDTLRNFAAIGPKMIPKTTAGTVKVLVNRMRLGWDRCQERTGFTQIPKLLNLDRYEAIEDDEGA